MVKDPPTRSLVWLIAAITLGLVVAITAAGFDLYFKTEILEQGDPAVNAIQIDNAKRFTEIYGNYSRFEFNHPGPAFFYVYAAGEWILHDLLGLVPSPHNAHVFASMVLQCLFLAIALAILADAFRWQAWLPFALLAATVHFSRIYGAFISIWPPHVLLMPFLCLLVAATSVASGRWRHLPLLVGVGGVLFHGHVAQALFVGGIGALALGLGYQTSRSEKGSWPSSWELLRAQRRPFAAALALTLLFLLPLAIDVWQRGLESNVATIIRRFLVNTGDSKTLLQGVLYAASFATYSQDQETVLASIGAETAQFFRDHAFAVTAWAVILVVSPLVAFRLRHRIDAARWRFLRNGYILLALTFVFCALWGLAQAGPMHHFNGYFYHSVYFFGLAFALALLARWMEGRFPLPIGGALCVVAAVVLTWSVRPPRLTEGETGLAIRRGVVEALANTPKGRPLILSFEHHNWPEAAAVGLELQRRGYPFYTVPTWNFMFGDEHNIQRLGPTPEAAAEVWWIAETSKEGTSITPTLAIYPRPPPIEPKGTEWRFKRADNGFRHVVRGLSVGNVELAWTEAPSVVFLLETVPASNDVRLTFEAEANSLESDRPTVQTAVVSFAGTELGQVSVSQRAEVSVRIPAHLWNAQKGPVKLELYFPHAVERRSFSRPRAREFNAWGLWSVRFETFP